jgi:hypothetical protein
MFHWAESFVQDDRGTVLPRLREGAEIVLDLALVQHTIALTGLSRLLHSNATIIRAHLRFCCFWCDQPNSGGLFKEHRECRERLRPDTTLYRITFRGNQVPCESSAIRTFEESVVGTVRQWMRGLSDWGFKSLTHYEDGVLVVEVTIALARGVSLLRPARRTTQITRLPSPPFSRHTVQKFRPGA